MGGCKAKTLILAGCSSWLGFFPPHAFAQVRLRETGGGTDYVSLQAPASISTNIQWILPATDGANNQCLATDGAGQLLWRTAGGTGYSLDANDGSPANALYVNASGNVGIGTTAPTSPLYVNAAPGANAVMSTLSASDATSDALLSFVRGGTNRWSVGLDASDSYKLKFARTTGAHDLDVDTKVTFDNSGNVGIGTTNPSAKLEVVGVVGAFPSSSGTSQVGNYARLYGSAQSLVLDIGGYGANGNWLQSTNRTDLSLTYPLLLNPNGGNVGIGLMNPTYLLHLSTDSAAKPGTSTWTIASDERLKDIRAPFTRGLDAINGLNTVYFNYKKDNPLGLPSEKEYVGIKAQDALKTIPEAVSTDEQGYLHITNDSIIWTAINAIKELYVQVIGHDHEIASLKTDNAQLGVRVERTEKENAEMRTRLEKLEQILNMK